MKKAICVILALASAFTLTGCTSVYSNFKEIEQLLVIQDLGLDKQGGGVLLSLCSASDESTGNVPKRLYGTGDSITTALEHIYNYSFEDILFCSHISHVLIGEKAAESGIDDYLSYICRSPIMRLDIPLFIVKGSTAQDAVLKVGDGNRGVVEIMDSVEMSVGRLGNSSLYTAAETVRNLDRCGSSLICAVELAEPLESDSGAPAGDSPSASEEDGFATQDDGSGKLTAVVYGYAVIRDGKLCKFLDRDEAIAVGFLTNKVGLTNVTVRDRHGSLVVLEIDSGGSEVTPVWSGTGELTGLNIAVDVRASIVEVSGSSDTRSAEYTDHITAQLEALISDYVSRVMLTSRELRSDFLCLAQTVERDDPSAFHMLPQSFPDLLPSLELQISVSGQLTHTNDVRDF